MTLSALKMDSDVEETTDVLGGGGVIDSSIYSLKIDAAYMLKSKKGALGVALRGEINGSPYREQVFITGGDAKGNKPFYERNGKKYPLPGYTTIDDICIHACNTSIADMETEEKNIKVYDHDEGKEVNTEVDMLVELIGETVSVAVKHIRKFKQEENAEGKWVDTAEIRDVNEISKSFSEDGFTVPELRKEEEATFADKWLAKSEGVVFGNAAKSDTPASAGTAGAPKPSGKRMFGAKATA